MATSSISGLRAHTRFIRACTRGRSYDVINDFTPVGLVVEQPFVVVARKDFPANGLREFAAYARLNPTKLQYASSTGAGSLNHLSCELLNSAIGVKITMGPIATDAGPVIR
jgi:tripartite-type tricarboxylate transporter receptor subunit TctC